MVRLGRRHVAMSLCIVLRSAPVTVVTVNARVPDERST
jgi:hypothetical protein